MVLCMHVSTRLVIDCYPWVWGIYFYAFRDAASGGNLVDASYAAGNSYLPNVAIALEWPLAQHFKLTLQLRKRWLEKAVYDSPWVDVK